MNIAQATHAPRIHHQWWPDYIRIESGLGVDTIRLLEEKGHKVRVLRTMGSVQSVMKIGRYFYGKSDPRTPEALTVGY
jgi:gamma-glutamyltranspeptidase/glutathione hydrolase